MEKRQSKRIIIGFKVEITHGGENYEGEIEDLSEGGVCVTAFPAEMKFNFSPEEMLDLKFQPNSDETLNLQCRIKWIAKAPPQGLKKRIGMEILDPPWDESGYFI